MPKKEQPKHQQKFTGSYSKRRSTRLSQRKAIQKFTLKISRNLKYSFHGSNLNEEF